MDSTNTGSIEAIQHPEVREDHLVELVLMASEATEDAFELDDLVDEWMRSESGENGALSSAPPLGPGSLALELDAHDLSTTDRAEAA